LKAKYYSQGITAIVMAGIRYSARTGTEQTMGLCRVDPAGKMVSSFPDQTQKAGIGLHSAMDLLIWREEYLN